MRTYIAKLSLRSGLGTPLAADTLWGHIAWGILYREGQASFQRWLDEYDGDSPPLIISDPFPEGFLPKPLVPPPLRQAEQPSTSTLDEVKRRSKRSWIPTSRWEVVSKAISRESVLNVMDTEPAARPVATSIKHASINRLTGGTAQEGGGSLFSAEQTYFSGTRCVFDTWVQSRDSADHIHKLLDVALSGGYGRDGASGMGDLRVESVEERSLPTLPGANAIMLLARAVPRSTDPATGYFGFELRCGRLGGTYAIGPTPNGSVQRQKRPFHCLSRGSILVTSHPVGRVGQLLRNVHEDPAIRHYALAPVIPIVLDRSLLEGAL